MDLSIKEEALKNRFPKLFQQVSPCLECGPGWYDIIFELSSKIYKYCESNHLVDYPQVVQIKEKFGGLRYYLDWVDKEHLTDIYKFIDEAEKKAYTTCEQCGKSGKTLTDRGWVVTLCEECSNANKKTA